MTEPGQQYGARPRPELLLMMANHPAALDNFRPLATAERRLSPRDQELAILRMAWLCQIPFVWGEHVRTGKAAGLSADDIERVTQGSAAPGWSRHERAVLRAVEELKADAFIGDETWAVLAEDLDAAQLVELPLLAGQYQALGYVQNTLRCPLWPGNDGLESR
jgi:alkylhydroperoxidase family enzyme